MKRTTPRHPAMRGERSGLRGGHGLLALQMGQQVHTGSGAWMGASLEVAGRLGGTGHLQQAKPAWCS